MVGNTATGRKIFAPAPVFVLVFVLAACTPLPKLESHGIELTPELLQPYIDGNYRIPVYVPQMKYPPRARKAGIEVDPVVEIDIDEAGRVHNPVLRDSSGNDELDRYVIEYVKSFRFEPADTYTYAQPQRINYELF